MQLQLEKKEPNQTQQTTEQTPQPGLSSPSTAIPLPARSLRSSGLCSTAARMLVSTSWAVNHRILSQRCTQWGRQKAGTCWRSDRCTELCKFAEFQSYEFLVIRKTPLRQNPRSWLAAVSAGLGTRERMVCSRGDTHHAPIGAVQRSRKGALSHFLPMLTPSSPADGSQDSYSLHQPHMTLCEKCVLLLHAHEPRSASQGKVLCRVWEAWSTKYCRAYRY